MTRKRRRFTAEFKKRVALGHGGDLPQAAHQRGQPGAPGVPVPAARPDDRPTGPRVVRGHHLPPCFGPLFLSRGRDGLGQPPCSVVAAVEHDGQRLLRRRAGRDAALRRGTPEIFNTRQGSQFTGIAFTDRVRTAGALCSMDGRGRYLDNIFIERLWRSLKYEAVYLCELSDGRDAEHVIGSWFGFYKSVS